MLLDLMESRIMLNNLDLLIATANYVTIRTYFVTFSTGFKSQYA
jgi:hypothetical protein